MPEIAKSRKQWAVGDEFFRMKYSEKTGAMSRTKESAFRLRSLLNDYSSKQENDTSSIIHFPMKHFRKELWYNVPARRGFVNITSEISRCVAESGIREGLALVNAMHITASVFINDDERGLHDDYERWLEELAPHEPTSHYKHNRTGEDNADAHLKRQIMGREVVVAITAGELDFGPWEQIFYGEFDGRRRKRVLVKIIGE